MGLYDSEYAEILSGLTGKELVVSTWSSNLYEGAKIRLWGEEEASREPSHTDSKEGRRIPEGA